MSAKKFGKAMLIALAATLVMGGCKNSQGPQPGQEYRSWGLGYGTYKTDRYEPARVTPAPTPNEPAPVTVEVAPPTPVGDGMLVARAAYPTGDPKTSAILLEKFYPAEVVAGVPYTYDLKVTNLTSLPLENVTVDDTIPSGFNMTGSQPQGRRGPGGETIWLLGQLNPGESKTIRVRGAATAEGSITSCAGVSYENSLCATTQVVQPNLQLAIEFPANVQVCDTIPITYTVCNPGSGAATNVVITETLPSGLSLVGGGQSISEAVGTLPAGECVSVTLQTKASGPGRYCTDGTATANGGLTVGAAQACVTVTQPILAIDVSCSQRQFIGRTATYEYTVRNTGSSDCTDALLQASVPAGATFNSASDGGTASGGTANWDIGNLPAGGTKTVRMTVTPQGAGTYQSTAAVECTCGTRVTDSCSTVVTGIPAILLEVIDIDDPIEVGNTVTYRIRATNQGSAPDSNIRITATFEAQQSFISAGGATNGTNSGRTVTFAPLGTLAPKAQATWEVVVRADAPANVRFGVQMTTDQLTRPVIENESTNLYE